MKRFYEEAKAAPAANGWRIELDGKPVMTPARNEFNVPAEQLGYGIAAEWNGQGEEVDPSSMPLTGFANAAIDRIAPDPASFAAELARYGETDLLCYRNDTPAALAAKQREAWDPLLDWAAERYGVEFETTTDIVHRPQPEATVAKLGEEIASYDAFHLAPLAPLVRLGGSLVAALALAEGAFEEDEVWAATRLDEDWQHAQWGEDEEAIAQRDSRRREFAAAMRFLRLLGT